MSRLVCVGLSTLDLVYRVVAAPGPDEKVVATSQELAAGGPAAGAAVTAAARGVAPTLVTSLGRHPLARFAREELAEQGVTVVDATRQRADPPALSSICVAESSGHRSVVSVNATGVHASIPSTLDETVAVASVVLVDGHLPELAVAAARAAARHGRLVVLDGGSWNPALVDLLPLVDVAACSAAFRVPGSEPGAASAVALTERYGVAAVAVTAGPAPVRWWVGAGGGHAGAVQVPAVRARDTLGAGDAFHGALAAALVACVAPSIPHEAGGTGETEAAGIGGTERAGTGGAGTRGAETGGIGGTERTGIGGVGGGKGIGVDVFVRALDFACRVAAVRCASVGARAWLADPRVAALAAELPLRGPA